jgi:hypothetical protein
MLLIPAEAWASATDLVANNIATMRNSAAHPMRRWEDRVSVLVLQALFICCHLEFVRKCVLACSEASETGKTRDAEFTTPKRLRISEPDGVYD